ncbi:MAG: endonuclease/exonuclease/phosphatase family protein [Euryarchaeota archaeon]|nr:endonuclease/exonuclease/phosphatase family protein [Euryarchaeota archaeon]
MEWNIRHGGCRESYPGIVGSVRHHDPDIVFFVEFRQERVIELSLALASNGWPYILSSQPPMKENGILAASKRPMEAPPRGYGEPNIPHRWMEVRPAGSDLRILSVQVPTASDLEGKMRFWEHLLDYARKMIDAKERAVIIGDLNTGLDIDADGIGFVGADKFQALLDMGMRDIWREYRQMSREYSWFSHKGNGYRLDHVLVTPFIDRPMWAKYSHKEREEGLSDHSPLIFDISDQMSEDGSIRSALRK